MRVAGMKTMEDGWVMYEFNTTYRLGWHSCVFLAKALYPIMQHVEILTSGGIGQPFVPVKIENENELLFLKEQGAIEVRGANTVYDNAPFSFDIFNQTDVVRMFVRKEYVESLKRSETEFLTEEERLHTFDKFMDSMEILGESRFAKYSTERETINKLLDALCMKENFTEHRVFKEGITQVDLTRVVNVIAANYIETHPPKTGGEEAVKAALNALQDK